MNLSVNGQSQVPPGFRFHPTEEELLHYYLRKKVTSEKIDLDVIRDVDLNKLEPWDIQEKCKIGSGPQNDWYFFSHKDKKYPTGTRTNRATAAGFWKATGRDKVIYSNCKRIGMRKTLVFYKGRAPHGQKSDWIMHEYRLDDNSPETTVQGTSLVGELSSAPEEGWVVCRVFKKKNYHKALESPHSSIVQSHPGNDGVLDQILTYMGRSSSSSSSKQQTGAKNGNNIIINGDDTMQFSHAIQAARFLHLPPLETQSAMEILSPHHLPNHTFEDLLAETEPSCNNTEPADDMKTAAGPADWVALDRLVASQLNGQVETSKSYVADDLSDGLYFPIIDHHRPFGRPNNHHHNSQVNAGNEVEFWSYTNSSSSPSDPLSHLSV